jgi:hypothetical protein
MAYRIELNNSSVRFEETKPIKETLGVLETKGQMYTFRVVEDTKNIEFEWVGLAPLSRKNYQEQIIKQFNLIKNNE